jgi:TolA-binding protein
MKRIERRHLKQNEFAQLALGARDVVEQRRGQIVGGVIAIAVVAAAIIGYVTYRNRVEGRAAVMLAEAIEIEQARVGPPPAQPVPNAPPSFLTERERAQAALTKLKTVADEYPSTDAGLEARYREAGVRMTLGTYKEAAASYQLVIDGAGDALIGQMARLGLAEAQTRAGQFDQAISIYTDLAQQKDERFVETVLMQLGKTYRDAGKRTEAEQTFNRLITEYPASQLAEDARREIESLKQG